MLIIFLSTFYQQTKRDLIVNVVVSLLHPKLVICCWHLKKVYLNYCNSSYLEDK
jgi:hypothetical protein